MNDQAKKLTSHGKAMARQMIKSWQAPQFSVETEIACEMMIRFRKGLPYKASYTAILAKAVADTLIMYPTLRSSWMEDHIVEHEEINIGIAVDTSRGLMVPVLFDVAGKPLEEVNAGMEAIKEKAAKGIYPIEQLQGCTFTISNLGIFNVSSFRAIVNAPECAILAVSKIADVPVVREGCIVPGKVMNVCVSVDHRVADGATAARFLTDLAATLESLGK